MSKKINFDIETLHPYQKDMLSVAYKYKGRGVVMMTGRHAGKSIFNSQTAFKRLWDDVMYRPVEALICNVQKVNGARFYTVQPEGGSWREMEEWCVNTFGAPGELWPNQDFNWPEEIRWAMNNRKFWFREEKDRDWFVIRWNS